VAQKFGILSPGSGTFQPGCTLYDPRQARLERRHFRRELMPQLELANSLAVPLGCYPACGYLLVRRQDYNQLDPYATYTLQIQDFENPPLTFHGLRIVQARCATTGVSSAADALYLVEVTDARGVLDNRWFTYPIQRSYNVRAPAYPTANDLQYYDYSLNGGAAWAWNQMIGDIWGTMLAFLGSFPGLPFSPLGSPENWQFLGVSAWQSLCHVLDFLGMAVSCDLTNTSPYSIVQLGATDNAFTKLQAKYKGVLEEDYQFLDLGAGRVPKYVRVFFHQRAWTRGIEETVRRDSFQWQANSIYSVLVTGPFASATGTETLWDDFTVRMDENSVPYPADVTTANTIANQLATEYFARIRQSKNSSLRQVYSRALPFKNGSLVDGVMWRQTGEGGWRTEIRTGDQPPWTYLASS
jgi:hypothetical protein